MPPICQWLQDSTVKICLRSEYTQHSISLNINFLTKKFFRSCTKNSSLQAFPFYCHWCSIPLVLLIWSGVSLFPSGPTSKSLTNSPIIPLKNFLGSSSHHGSTSHFMLTDPSSLTLALPLLLPGLSFTQLSNLLLL